MMTNFRHHWRHWHWLLRCYRQLVVVVIVVVVVVVVSAAACAVAADGSSCRGLIVSLSGEVSESLLWQGSCFGHLPLEE